MDKVTWLAAALAATILAGCAGQPKAPNKVTIGQQLIDLKEARDSKAITEQEYRKARRNIVNDAR